MTKLKTVILDDEFPALKMMEDFVNKTDFLELQAEFSNPKAALDFIQKNNTDLLLSDIKMPHLNGLNLAAQIPKNTICIFLSASPEFALQAFEVDVVDYILKPYSYERFLKAATKAKEFYHNMQNHGECISIKADYMTHKIPVEHIKWVEGFSEYIKIITLEKNYAVLMRLSHFEEQYKTFGFVRIHRSYIIHKNQILSYTADKVKLIEGEELPIGRTYRANIDFS